MIELELWHLISLVITIIGAFWTLGKMMLFQAKAQIDQQFKLLGDHMRLQDESDRRLEREIMELKATLPRDYVRREDYVLAIATITTKIDNLHLRLEGYFRDLMTKGQNRE